MQRFLIEGDGLRAKCTDSFQLLLQGETPISIDREEQEKLYAILGDVNPQYLLSIAEPAFFAQISQKEVVQKRRDIFVDSLVLLGYIIQK